VTDLNQAASQSVLYSEGQGNPIRIVELVAAPVSSALFAPYGQVITASPDGKPFDATDAQVELSEGVPRFYIMQILAKGLMFDRITRHDRCTQCLGSLRGKTWWIAVAPANAASREPDRDRLRAFEVPGDCFLKLNRGTWHAGPYFEEGVIDFYNLELSDTYVNDHFTHVFSSRDRCKFVIKP
jgi:ureidoglycolate hydrolase